MLEELRHHKFAYSFLVIGLVTAILLFLGAWPNRPLQRVIALGLATYYMLWGILTHLKNNHINKRVLLEYVAVGGLAGILLLLVTI